MLHSDEEIENKTACLFVRFFFRLRFFNIADSPFAIRVGTALLLLFSLQIIKQFGHLASKRNNRRPMMVLNTLPYPYCTNKMVHVIYESCS